MNTDKAFLSPVIKGSNDSYGEVWLVGAGPGDPDLLTVKALRLIQSASVVVYDRLVGSDILALLPSDAMRFDVGKEAGNHKMPQDEINQLLVVLAHCGEQVIRLKGGDPFISGRGGEEMQALQLAGVKCHIVPGITAAMGCAASTGIPLTLREVSQSVRFITGHEMNGEPAWCTLANMRRNETLVVYMGIKWLQSLTSKLRALGWEDELPFALIENGTLSSQRVTVTTLKDLSGGHELSGIASPCLIIVGEVVRQYCQKKATNAQPKTRTLLAGLSSLFA